MKISVLKYGGTSVGSVENIKKIAKQIKKRKEKEENIVIILSAMGNTTNKLIETAKKISKNPSPREMDMLLTTGEQASISLLTMALINIGVKAISYTGYQLNISTTGFHQKSKIKDIDTSKIIDSLKTNKVVVVAGFQGVNNNKDITTLGRGGSDTSAIALAIKLKAKCEIYTDVEGVFTSDPNKYDFAKKIDVISYDEILEMACLGASVIHPRAVEIAKKYSLEIYIGSSFSNVNGTIIKKREETIESPIIKGIATSSKDIKVDIYNMDYRNGDTYEIFRLIAENEINIDIISQVYNENKKINISFIIPNEDFEVCKKIINEYFENSNRRGVIVDFDEDISKISIVGIGIRTTPGVLSKVYNLMAKENIEVKMLSTSDINITWAVKKDEEERVVNLIGEEFLTAYNI